MASAAGASGAPSTAEEEELYGDKYIAMFKADADEGVKKKRRGVRRSAIQSIHSSFACARYAASGTHSRRNFAKNGWIIAERLRRRERGGGTI